MAKDIIEGLWVKARAHHQTIAVSLLAGLGFRCAESYITVMIQFFLGIAVVGVAS